MAKSGEIRSELREGAMELATTLKKAVVPLVLQWSNAAMAAANGVDSIHASDNDKQRKKKKQNNEDDGAKVREELRRQLLGQQFAIIANAHLVLLASPMLSNISDWGQYGEYPDTKTGAEQVKNCLGAMSYVTEWYGKGTGSSLYGNAGTPPIVPPPSRANVTFKAFAGTKNMFPALEFSERETGVEDADTSALLFSPSSLWATFCEYRNSISRWISRKTNAEYLDGVISHLVAKAMGDDNASWAELKDGSAFYGKDRSGDADDGGDIESAFGYVAPELAEILDKERLPFYAPVLADEGFGKLRDIATATDEELRQLIKTCKMKKPEQRRWKKVVLAVRRACGMDTQGAPIEEDERISLQFSDKESLAMGLFTSADEKLRVDLAFAAIYFRSGNEGPMPMPDSISANRDLQEYLKSEREGIVSNIMPHVVAHEFRVSRVFCFVFVL